MKYYFASGLSKPKTARSTWTTSLSASDLAIDTKVMWPSLNKCASCPTSCADSVNFGCYLQVLLPSSSLLCAYTICISSHVYIVANHPGTSEILPDFLPCPGRVLDDLLQALCPGILTCICSVTPPMLDHSPIMRSNTHLCMCSWKGRCLRVHKRSAKVSMIAGVAAVLYSSMAESIKFNSNSCCYDTELPPELLEKCKKATSVALGKQQTRL